MASVSLVQGKLGGGKGKYTVMKIREYLLNGQRVATNMDLFLDKLLPPDNRMTVTRLPDKPTAEDLIAIGKGYEGRIGSGQDGLLALDELGSWLNARSFQDKGRAGFLDWLIHARKYRWETMLLAQSIDMIDKQVRVSVCQYIVSCTNMERVKIPVIGQFMGKKGTMPRFHIANTSLAEVPGIKIDSDWYRADDLQDGYDTEQVFREWAREPSHPQFHDETFAGPFSYLSAWHLVGRHQTAPAKAPTLLSRLFKTPEKKPLKPKHPLIEKLAKLPPDKAWHYARLLNNQGAFA